MRGVQAGEPSISHLDVSIRREGGETEEKRLDQIPAESAELLQKFAASLIAEGREFTLRGLIQVGDILYVLLDEGAEKSGGLLWRTDAGFEYVQLDPALEEGERLVVRTQDGLK